MKNDHGKCRRGIAAFMAVVITMSLIPLSALGASESKTVPYTCPAICAEAGETVVLSDYSVEFEAGKTVSAQKIAWTSSDVEIKNGTVSAAAGVYLLTAEANGTQKTVCLSVRADKNSEYVLYHNDFSGTEADGLRIIEQTAGGTVKFDSEGVLILDASASKSAYSRVLLPEYLDAFGDIKIEARVKIDKAANTKRWGSVMLRVQNTDYPYMQLCLRSTASLDNGTEIAERTSANKWNVTQKGPASIKSSEFNTITADASGGELVYYINGVENLRETSVTLDVGACGFQANGCRLTVDEVTISVGRVSNTKTSIASVKDPDSNIVLPPSVITETDSKAKLDGIASSGASTAVMKINSSLDVLAADGSVIAPIADALEALDGSVIPAFRPSDADAATALGNYLAETETRDVFVISENAELISTVRGIWYHARGILDLTDRHDLSASEVCALHDETNAAGARILLISEALATKENVERLQELFMTVWTRVTTPTVVAHVGAITTGVNGIITSDPAALTACFTEYFGKNTIIRAPEIIGHRGVPSLAHENTISGSLKAYELGATMIENDIHLTRDGVVVVMHNATIDATTNGSGTIAAMTYEQLSKYKVISNKNLTEGEPIPTLEDYFKTFGDKDVKLVVELKSTDKRLIPALVKLIEQYDYAEKMVVISFSADQIKLLRESLPGISAGYLTSNTYSSSSLNASLTSILNDVQLNGTTFNPTYGKGALDAELIKALAYRGVTVWPWTINDASAFATYFLSGAGGLTTNYSQYSTKLIKSVETDKTSYDLAAGETPVVTALTYERNTRDVTDSAAPIVLESTGDLAVSLDYTTGKLTYTGTGSATVIFSVSCKVQSSTYRIVSNVVTLTAQPPVETSAEPDTTSPETTPESPNGNGCGASATSAWILLAVTTAAILPIVSKRKYR